MVSSSVASDFTAVIDWGDGGPASTGTISGPDGGPFTVTGSHTYDQLGPYTITITITDDGGATTTATAHVIVYAPSGFAIGDTDEPAEMDADRRDADSLYRMLEEELIPRFYDRDETDLPRRWLAMMKRSIQTLVPAFNSDRMVAEYAERIY